MFWKIYYIALDLARGSVTDSEITVQVNPFGVAFSLIKRSDLIQVNHHGDIIDGGPVRLLNTAAFMIRKYTSSFGTLISKIFLRDAALFCQLRLQYRKGLLLSIIS